MYNFDAKKVKNEIVEWIKLWFEENGPDCKAVIGISGGIDSSTVAALCVEALGRERVYAYCFLTANKVILRSHMISLIFLKLLRLYAT